MSTYVLVHGSWHGAWCWYKVVARLEQAGHRVIAPDLPSLGSDKTPIGEISPHNISTHLGGSYSPGCCFGNGAGRSGGA